ncbi:MAG TPA: fumarylacetoacetate hydrolase family protein [Burkholderiales bacterium]|nr:fumarylacetoacetate hydrolase family protein [Burkholderiales bacterium]
MKLATLKDDTRDGALLVVSRDLKHATIAYDVAPTLQAALDDWDYASPQLQTLYETLNRSPQALGSRAFELEPQRLAAPLPRAYQWLDGSAYLAHVELVRKARGASMPAEFKRDPLMYQGDSQWFIGPCDPIEAASEDWGIDLEAEVAVFLDDVPMGVKADRASEHVRLLALVNDVSLRNLIPAELAKGFGFVHGKAATAFSPVAVTPEELGDAWDGRRLKLPMRVSVNGKPFGSPDCGTDMQFGFHQLIAHAAATRPLGAGTVLGSGTISNYGYESGHACIAERRALETVKKVEPQTPFLRFGDRVRIEVLDTAGGSIFGAIDQPVSPPAVP